LYLFDIKPTGIAIKMTPLIAHIPPKILPAIVLFILNMKKIDLKKGCMKIKNMKQKFLSTNQINKRSIKKFPFKIKNNKLQFAISIANEALLDDYFEFQIAV
jgi:hypothetical protein